MNEAVVIAVGPGHRDTNGVLVPMTVAVGDMVLLPGFGGVGVKIGSEVSFFFLLRVPLSRSPLCSHVERGDSLVMRFSSHCET